MSSHFILFLVETHQQRLGIKGRAPVRDKGEHRSLVAVTGSFGKFEVADRRQTWNSRRHAIVDVSDRRAAGISKQVGNEIAALIRPIHDEHRRREGQG